MCAFNDDHAVFDDYAGVVLDAEGAGTPVLIDPAMAVRTAEQVGSHVAGGKVPLGWRGMCYRIR